MSGLLHVHVHVRGTNRSIDLRDGVRARILGVSDFLDALTSARAYRDAMPLDEVVDLIKQSAGTHFDPAVADVAVRRHERGGLLPEDRAT